jgi:hypothetical protein
VYSLLVDGPARRTGKGYRLRAMLFLGAKHGLTLLGHLLEDSRIAPPAARKKKVPFLGKLRITDRNMHHTDAENQVSTRCILKIFFTSPRASGGTQQHTPTVAHP